MLIFEKFTNPTTLSAFKKILKCLTWDEVPALLSIKQAVLLVKSVKKILGLYHKTFSVWQFSNFIIHHKAIKFSEKILNIEHGDRVLETNWKTRTCQTHNKFIFMHFRKKALRFATKVRYFARKYIIIKAQ